MSEREPTEEELRAALEEQMSRITVDEVLLQTVVTLVNVTGRRLTAEKDLAQAKTGIEAIRALLPLCPERESKPIRDALSQLQMVFAREAQAPAGQGAATTAGAERPEAEEPTPKDPEAEQRAKARSKIWTPPGA